jgi:hypothetical protein
MRIVLVGLISMSTLAMPNAAVAQSKCGLLQATGREPATITALQRDGYSAYLNDSAPADQQVELHIIGSYDGSGHVSVMPSAKPVVLLLAAYKPGLWRVKLAAGARLARVVLLGVSPQRVQGVGADVPIVDRTGCGNAAYQWQAHNRDVAYMPEGYKRFLAAAHEASGLIESSFQGHYGLGGAYSVPPAEAQYRRRETVTAPATPRTRVRHDRAATMAGYEAAMAQAPGEVRPTMKILVDLMERGKLPFVFPIGDPGPDPRAPGAVRPLFDSAGRIPQTGPQTASCDRVILGRREGQTVKCSWGNHFYVMGNGPDVIDDSWGDDIVNPGAGDDVIDFGWGNDILVLESGWGDDIVGKTCTNSRISDADRARLAWQHRYTNFIVFGPGIRPADMRWESKSVLTHPPSQSRLTFKDDCFNLVFTEDGELAPFRAPGPSHTPPPSRGSRS